MFPALAALLALTLVRLLVAASMPLSPDEAYYWTWSRALAPGYLDHPPMVALWIRAGTALAGQTALGVRLLAPVSALAGSILLWRAGEDLLPGAGLRAAALFNATLVAAAGAVTMTPDTPLLFFWVAALWAAGRLVRTGRARWWWAVGAAAGLALDSKYTALLLGAALLTWLLAVPAARPWLRRPAPWGAALLAAVLFAPVLWWNATHGWASFARQGGRTADWAPQNALRFLGELLASQFGLATPLVLVLCAWGVWRLRSRWREPGPALLLALTFVPLLVFVQHALGDRVQANWPAVLYPSAAIASAALPARRLSIAATALGLALAAPVYLQSAAAPFPLPRRLDPTLVRLAGWAELARDAEAARLEAGATTIAAEPYGTEAELAWHGLPVLAPGPRWRLLDLPGATPPGPVLLIETDRRATPPDPAPWASLEPAGRLLRARAGVEAEAFRLYLAVPRPGAAFVRLPTPPKDLP